MTESQEVKLIDINKSAKYVFMLTNSVNLKAQSAIEYLMTYGWMLLVVAIVGGAIFSVVGGQNIENVQGFDNSDVNIQDFGVSQEDGLMFSMSDPIGQTEVQEIKVSNPDTANVNYILGQSLTHKNVVNLPGVVPSDESGELEVEIIYDAGNLENLSTSGAVTGNLEVDENFNNRTIIIDGLIGYWPLDSEYSNENTVYDLSSNNNHGEKENNPQVVDSIVGDQALEFWWENEQEVSFESQPYAMSSSESWSVSFWAALNETGEEGNPDSGDWSWPGIVDRGGVSGENAWGFWRRQRDGTPSTVVFEVNGDNGERHRASSETFEAGELFHIVGVYNAEKTELSLYNNGSLEDTTQYTDTGDFDGDHDFAIGRDSGRTRWLSGFVDNVYIYDRALSENEVEVLYEEGN